MAKVTRDQMIAALLARRIRVPSNMSYFFNKMFDEGGNVVDWSAFARFIRLLVDTAPECFRGLIAGTISGLLEEFGLIDPDIKAQEILAYIEESTKMRSTDRRFAHLDPRSGT